MKGKSIDAECVYESLLSPTRFSCLCVFSSHTHAYTAAIQRTSSNLSIVLFLRVCLLRARIANEKRNSKRHTHTHTHTLSKAYNTALANDDVTSLSIVDSKQSMTEEKKKKKEGIRNDCPTPFLHGKVKKKRRNKRRVLHYSNTGSRRRTTTTNRKQSRTRESLSERKRESKSVYKAKIACFSRSTAHKRIHVF